MFWITQSGKEGMKRVLQICLLLHMVVAGLIPSGFMPVFQESDTFSIVICSPDGLKRIANPDRLPLSDEHSSSLCIWAERNTEADPTVVTQIAPTLIIYDNHYDVLPEQQPRSAEGRLYDGRAPPALD